MRVSEDDAYQSALKKFGIEMQRTTRPDKDRMLEKAIQVGVRVMNVITSIEKWASTHEPLNKCRQCLYVTMTAAELAELGSDPCETCNSHSHNWQTNKREKEGGKQE